MKFRMVTDAPLVAEVLTAAGWRHTEQHDWNLIWHRRWDARDVAVARPDAGPTYCNHLPGIRALNNKVEFYRTAAAAGRRSGSSHFLEQHVPRTYEMPFDRPALVAAAHADPSAIWIAKPSNGARGEGIYLLPSAEEAPTARGWIVQEYLANPHLLDGRKYTLRIYVLISSLVPLIAHIYTKGLVKRAAVPFTLHEDLRSNPHVHLTSAAVQRQAPGGPLPPIFLDEYLEPLAQSGNGASLWPLLRRIAIQAILAARPKLVRERRRFEALRTGCFELLGLDFLINDDLRPWLLEVNAGPSVRIETPLGVAGLEREGALKRHLIRDVLRLTGPLTEPPPRDADARAGFIHEHCGDFERLIPMEDPDAHHGEWFPLEEDARLSAALGLDPPRPPDAVLPDGVALSGDGAIAFSQESQRFLALNELATAVALWSADGLPRPELCSRLVSAARGAVRTDQAPHAVDAILADIWDLRAPALSRPSAAVPAQRLTPAAPNVRAYDVSGTIVCVRFHDRALLDAVADSLGRAAIDPPARPAYVVDVTGTADGIRIDAAPWKTTTVRERSLAAALLDTMLMLACLGSGGTIAFPGAVLRTAKGGIALLGGSEAVRGMLTLGLANAGLPVVASAHLILDERFHARPAVVRGLLPTPPDLPAAGQPLAALFFPRIRARFEPRLQRIGRREAFERLAADGFETLRELEPSWVSRMMEWLETRERFAMTSSSVGQDVEAIVNWATC